MSRDESMFGSDIIEELEIANAIESSDSSYTMSPNTTVRIAREQYSVFEFTRQIQRGRVDISPDFQRFNAWNPLQKSELIESILMGIPIPILYLFENEFGQRQVIDGKQRLTAMRDFVGNQFDLSGLRMLSQYNGFYFHHLPPILQAKIEDCQIQTYIVQPPTPEVVKFYIFERINRSGTQLNQQEMRHALHQGNATELLIDIADEPEFGFFGMGRSDRMRREYMALRYLTFYLCANNYMRMPHNVIDVNELLSQTMKYLNGCDHNFINYLKFQSKRSFRDIHIVLGEKAFTHDKYRNTILISIFEVFSYVFSSPELIGKINSHRNAILDILNVNKTTIVEGGKYYGDYNDINTFWHRIQLAREIIEEVKIA
ncbi:TPA: DUF262 domain-containing protein [Vibrio parahaemolyticus]|nr:DUF262 domain-containing protein [Vibrio parahaemolyticus]